MEVPSKFLDPKRIRASRGKRASGDFWHRLMPWVYLTCFIFFVVIVSAFLWPQIKRNQDIQKRKELLAQRIEDIKEESRLIEEELYALQDDRLYIERMARDVLNYGRPGETIFKFPPYVEDDQEQENKQQKSFFK
ncbi:MAG: septum formation initiator family protein [Verrucomicrobiota bacterium]